MSRFLPPDLSPHYLAALARPLAETLEMAAGAILLAVILGLASSIWIAARLPGSRLVYGGLAALRSIPDLTLAIFCVIVAGIGPGAGMLALAIFYSAAMGKVFADLLRAADAGPVEAVRATGAREITVVLFAHLQLQLRDIVSFGGYELECAVRSSVIVGAVGGGGLGTEIAGSIGAFDFRRTTTLILLLIALIAGIERLMKWLPKHSWAAWLFVAAAGAGVARQWPELLTLQHAAATVASMLPPQLPAEALRAIPRLLAETLFIALAGTAIGLLAALLLGLCATRGIAPPWLGIPVRRCLEALRAVPEVVWALILMNSAGIGPVAGAAAVGIHSAGCLGRLFSDSFDNVPAEPVRALAAAGGGRVAMAAFGYVPLALPAVAIHTMFRLEWNIRAAAVVGMIGAGGIGGALFNSQQLFFYRQTTAWILLTCALVFLGDWVSSRVRSRI